MLSHNLKHKKYKVHHSHFSINFILHYGLEVVSVRFLGIVL